MNSIQITMSYVFEMGMGSWGVHGRQKQARRCGSAALHTSCAGTTMDHGEQWPGCKAALHRLMIYGSGPRAAGPVTEEKSCKNCDKVQKFDVLDGGLSVIRKGRKATVVLVKYTSVLQKRSKRDKGYPNFFKRSKFFLAIQGLFSDPKSFIAIQNL